MSWTVMWYDFLRQIRSYFVPQVRAGSDMCPPKTELFFRRPIWGAFVAILALNNGAVAEPAADYHANEPWLLQNNRWLEVLAWW